jgi:hypothetical protein
MKGKEDAVANYFSWHVVERSRRDPDLRGYQRVKEEYLVEAKCCPEWGEPPEPPRWVYVRDDPQSSKPPRPVPCREGYLLICDAWMLQVDFFCEKRG